MVATLLIRSRRQACAGDKVPGGALTAADFRKAAEAGGFTGNIIVGTDLANLRLPRSSKDARDRDLGAAVTPAPPNLHCGLSITSPYGRYDQTIAQHRGRSPARLGR